MQYPPYPDWFGEFRPHQRAAIDKIVGAFNAGNKVVVLDAPTGAGKTIIGEAVRRELDSARALYVCSTKSLQDQFVQDFPYSAVLKGKANYPTVRSEEVSCDDCMWTKDKPVCMFCPSKGDCPYEVAKLKALNNPLAVINTAYMLTECNGPGRFSGRDLVIADEADVLEGELLRHVSLEITPRRAEELGIRDPSVVTHSAKGAHDSWQEWCEDALVKVRQHLPQVDEDAPLSLVRKRKSLLNLYAKIVKVRNGLGEGGWVYTGKGGETSFKPIRVDSVGAESFWPHGDRFLLMSATIISARTLVESLGLVDVPWEFVEVGSTFPKENRPVKIMPVANMARKPTAEKGLTDQQLAALRREEQAKMVEGLRAVVWRHPNERILVHAVSYDLSRSLVAGLQEAGIREVFSYTQASDRQTTLSLWLGSDAGVLIAPSLDRGIDLADDKCRVVVIAKIPFPNLGDRQINAKLHSPNGQTWYTVEVVRTIVQMAGRAMRNKDDQCYTYILDSQFSNNAWNRGRTFFPPWFVEAFDWRDKFTVAELEGTSF